MNQNNIIIALIFAVVLVSVLIERRLSVFGGKNKPEPKALIVPTKWQAETHRKLRAALQEAMGEDVSDGIRARIEALSNASLLDILTDPDDYCDSIEAVLAEATDDDIEDEDDGEDDGDITSDHLDNAWHFAMALSDSIRWPEAAATPATNSTRPYKSVY